MKLNAKWKSEKKALEDRGLKINRKKTEYIKFYNKRGIEVRLQDEILKGVDKFKYLRSTVTGIEEKIGGFPLNIEWMEKLEKSLKSVMG